MPYNTDIDRSDAGVLIPTEVEEEIFQHVPENSFVMRMARRLRDMNTNERDMRVLEGLVTAYRVGASTAASGDKALIQTSDMSWADKTIRAAKFGVIIPVPNDVFDDSSYDLWAVARPQITEAFGRCFDAAVLYGTDAPTDWPDDLTTGATAAGNTVSLAAPPPDGVDMYDCILSEGGVVSKVEECGYMVNGHIAHMSMRAKMRGSRDGQGHPLFTTEPTGPFRYYLDGEPVAFPRNGIINPALTLDVCGDWSQLVYALRKGVTFEILKEAAIFDSNGVLVLNLAQADCKALKATFRLGWELPTPPNRLDATPYPFGILTP